MLKIREGGLDAATVQQAIVDAQWLIKMRGGLSHEHSKDYWRFSTKAELCGRVKADERFVQGIKDAFAKDGEVSVSFLPGPMIWNEKLAAKLIADAERGDADADQVLREVAAEYLKADEKPPKLLAHYAGTCLWPPAGREKARQQLNSSKPQSHKTDYRDWILALTVDDIARHFKLNHTRNDATEEHCACSIVKLAAEVHENTVQNAWHRYQGIADRRTATNYVAEAVVSVPAREYLMPFRVRWPGLGTSMRQFRVLTSDGAQVAQEHFLVRFPRVGSTEAKPRAKPRPKRQSDRKA
jgi:hypothetical protein